MSRLCTDYIEVTWNSNVNASRYPCCLLNWDNIWPVVCLSRVCLDSKIPVQFYFIIPHCYMCVFIPPVRAFQFMLLAQLPMYSSGNDVMSSFALFMHQLGQLLSKCMPVSSFVPHNLHLLETGCLSIFALIAEVLIA